MTLVDYKSFQIEYQIIGDLEWLTHLVFAFPGFGRLTSDFEIFLPLLKKGEVICAINLFGHGKSAFPKSRPLKRGLNPGEQLEILEFLCQKLGVANFSLLAYSLGGKIALSILEFAPDKIKKVTFLAPDGVKKNLLYKFSANTAFGRWMYKGIEKNPKFLLDSSRLLTRLRLLPKKLLKFVEYHMASKERRQLVGDVWMIYPFFEPDIPKIQENINTWKIPTVLIYGKYDRVIPIWQGEKLNDGLEKDSLNVLENGHLLVDEKTIQYLDKNNLW